MVVNIQQMFNITITRGIPKYLPCCLLRLCTRCWSHNSAQFYPGCQQCNLCVRCTGSLCIDKTYALHTSVLIRDVLQNWHNFFGRVNMFAIGTHFDINAISDPNTLDLITWIRMPSESPTNFLTLSYHLKYPIEQHRSVWDWNCPAANIPQLWLLLLRYLGTIQFTTEKCSW